MSSVTIVSMFIVVLAHSERFKFLNTHESLPASVVDDDLSRFIYRK